MLAWLHGAHFDLHIFYYSGYMVIILNRVLPPGISADKSRNCSVDKRGVAYTWQMSHLKSLSCALTSVVTLVVGACNQT